MTSLLPQQCALSCSARLTTIVGERHYNSGPLHFLPRLEWDSSDAHHLQTISFASRVSLSTVYLPQHSVHLLCSVHLASLRNPSPTMTLHPRDHVIATTCMQSLTDVLSPPRATVFCSSKPQSCWSSPRASVVLDHLSVPLNYIMSFHPPLSRLTSSRAYEDCLWCNGARRHHSETQTSPDQHPLPIPLVTLARILSTT